jgi:hypothetical protein
MGRKKMNIYSFCSYYSLNTILFHESFSPLALIFGYLAEIQAFGTLSLSNKQFKHFDLSFLLLCFFRCYRMVRRK